MSMTTNYVEEIYIYNLLVVPKYLFYELAGKRQRNKASGGNGSRKTAKR
jgi:hypothetical protein